jgi:hypothetical protein
LNVLAVAWTNVMAVVLQLVNHHVAVGVSIPANLNVADAILVVTLVVQQNAIMPAEAVVWVNAQILVIHHV